MWQQQPQIAPLILFKRITTWNETVRRIQVAHYMHLRHLCNQFEFINLKLDIHYVRKNLFSPKRKQYFYSLQSISLSLSIAVKSLKPFQNAIKFPRFKFSFPPENCLKSKFTLYFIPFASGYRASKNIVIDISRLPFEKSQE